MWAQPTEVRSVVFGAPMSLVFGQDLDNTTKELLQSISPKTHNLVYDTDVVPRLPGHVAYADAALEDAVDADGADAPLAAVPWAHLFVGFAHGARFVCEQYDKAWPAVAATVRNFRHVGSVVYCEAPKKKNVYPEFLVDDDASFRTKPYKPQGIAAVRALARAHGFFPARLAYNPFRGDFVSSKRNQSVRAIGATFDLVDTLEDADVVRLNADVVRFDPQSQHHMFWQAGGVRYAVEVVGDDPKCLVVKHDIGDGASPPDIVVESTSTFFLQDDGNLLEKCETRYVRRPPIMSATEEPESAEEPDAETAPVTIRGGAANESSPLENATTNVTDQPEAPDTDVGAANASSPEESASNVSDADVVEKADVESDASVAQGTSADLESVSKSAAAPVAESESKNESAAVAESESVVNSTQESTEVNTSATSVVEYSGAVDVDTPIEDGGVVVTWYNWTRMH